MNSNPVSHDRHTAHRVERASAGKPGAQPVRILIADDHALIRKGLKQVLADEFQHSEIGEAGNAKEAIALASSQAWDAGLLDITMPGQSGLEVLKQFKELYPGTPVLVLSMHPEDQYAMRALKAGASGYLTKNTASEQVASALRKVLAGGTFISHSLAEDLAHRLTEPNPRAPYELLSDREFQIMSSLASGKS